MQKIIFILGFIFLSLNVIAKDEKLGRFFEDQPDITDDYQIHFIYMLAADGKDREWDINEKIENITKKMNNLHKKLSGQVKGSSGNKSYKYDFRKDGKLDITFIRLDRARKNLHKHLNNNYRGYLWSNKFNNPKKVYFTFADVTSEDGGEGGVGMASMFLGSKYNKKEKHIVSTALHELHHTQGGGFSCVPGMGKNAHWKSRDGQNTVEGQIFMKEAYVHNIKDCPKGEDSVYLTPTSKNPYDPFKLICLKETGKYKNFGGAGCKFSNGNELFTNKMAKKIYKQK